MRCRRTTLIRFGLLASGTAVILLAVSSMMERRILFKNRHNHVLFPPPADLMTQDVWLRTPQGMNVHAWWCSRPGAVGAVLFCQGKSGNLSQRAATIRRLQAGLSESVLIFDYPGFGRSDGEPSEAAFYGAASAAYDWLAQRLSPGRIILVGQSLGGGVATELACGRSYRALVLIKTFTSLPDVVESKVPLLPARWLMSQRFDNLAKISRCGGKVFIAHGDRDELIPLSQAERLYQAAPGPKRFLLLPNCGHNGDLSPELWESLAQFLETLASLLTIQEKTNHGFHGYHG